MPDNQLFVQALLNAKRALVDETVAITNALRLGIPKDFKEVKWKAVTLKAAEYAISQGEYGSDRALDVYSCLKQIAGLTGAVIDPNAQGSALVNISVGGGTGVVMDKFTFTNSNHPGLFDWQQKYVTRFGNNAVAFFLIDDLPSEQTQEISTAPNFDYVDAGKTLIDSISIQFPPGIYLSGTIVVIGTGILGSGTGGGGGGTAPTLPPAVLDFSQPFDMVIGQPDQSLSATSSNSNYTDSPIAFSSGSPLVAPVLQGKLRALSPGQSVLSATQPAGGGFGVPAPATRTVQVFDNVENIDYALLINKTFNPVLPSMKIVLGGDISFNLLDVPPSATGTLTLVRGSLGNEKIELNGQSNFTDYPSGAGATIKLGYSVDSGILNWNLLS
jgi:hypothetical protein